MNAISPLEKVLYTESRLDKLGAACEITKTRDATAIRQIALQYQLISKQTSLFLVHEQAEKAKQLPILAHIQQMMPAGSSGYGSTRTHYSVPKNSPWGNFDCPPLWRCGAVIPADRSLEIQKTELYDIPAFLRRQADEKPDIQKNTLLDIRPIL